MEKIIRAVRWAEAKKKYAVFSFGVALLVLFLMPRSYRAFGIVLLGAGWHVFHAETAAAFWLGIGFRGVYAIILAAVSGTIIAYFFCLAGFYVTDLKHHWIEKCLASWSSTNRRPYVGYASIIAFGLFLPFFGVVAGIILAKNTRLPKIPAIAAILGTNFVKLCGWGKGVALIFPYLAKLTHILFS